MQANQPVSQGAIDASQSLLYSPYNSISSEYGEATSSAFRALGEDIAHKLTASQSREFKRLEKYIITNHELRPFGSLMPYFIADYFGLPCSAAHKVSKSWLALYLWSVCIDKVMDREQDVPPEGHMLYAQLLTYFIDQTTNQIISNRTRAKVLSALTDAMRFQSYSTPHAKLDEGVALEDIRAGKNLLFLSIGLLLAGDEQESGAVEKLCEKFSSVLQALDDITDIRADMELGITTPILDRIRDQKVESTHTDLDVLATLVRSGALLEELKWIEREIADLVTVCPNDAGAAAKFLGELQKSVSTLIHFIQVGDMPNLQKKIGEIYCTT